MAQPQANQQRRAQPATTSSTWNVEMFSCSEDTSFFDVLFRPCVGYGRAEERMRNPLLENYDGTNSECKSCCVAGPAGCLYVKKQRTAIREKYGIEGSGASDCFTALCCPGCAAAQHDAEVESRNPKKRNVDKVGYRPNTNTMSMYASPNTQSWYAGADMRTASVHR